MLYLAFTLFSLHVIEPASRVTHVRGLTAPVRAVIERGMRDSHTFRGLVQELEKSDVVVYVDELKDPHSFIDGDLAFLSAAAGYRYVRVRIALRSRDSRNVSTLGHELQHALEISERRWIVDAKTMRRAYAQIGHRNNVAHRTGGFDTVAAIEVGDRVRREMWR